MLYETQLDFIKLQQEIEYIEKYIQLQKIRHSQENYVMFKCSANMADKTIAPMLLIPIIENAFKYGSSISNGPAIKIEIILQGELLFFTCENHFQKSSQLPGNGGLGLTLIQKRLNLLYPKHQLHITAQSNFYQVKLQLKLDEYQLPNY